MRIEIMNRQTSFWAVILLITVFLEYGSDSLKPSVSEVLKNKKHSSVESEKMLEQNIDKGSLNQWSGWSNWSVCSRSCDGGVAQQIRRCTNPKGCKGDAIRYRICNTQPCKEPQDYRAQQCATYNDLPYNGILYQWTTHYDYEVPCALTCRGRPVHAFDDSGDTGPNDPEHYDESSVIVQLSSRVHDGTRCHAGSLDMCIQGKCQRVGCDLEIGSTKKIDVCGVCGGDGTSCSQPLYHWALAPMSQCTVSCGGGYKMSLPKCINRVSGNEVEDSLCIAMGRPEPFVEVCNTQNCPPKWIADDKWTPCSRLCGTGYRERIVLCAEEKNGIIIKVPDNLCQSPKPTSKKACFLEECPKWEVEEWSRCSETCGYGIQMREVECKASDGTLSAKCDPLTKPVVAQQCTTGLSCNSEPEIKKKDRNKARERDDDDDDMEVDDIDDSEEESYNDQPMDEDDDEDYSHLHYPHLDDDDEEFPSPEPTFIKDKEWSACSVTCGEGIRRRSYKCKIFLELSEAIATVHDSHCEGPKPPDEVESCSKGPCEQYLQDSVRPGKKYIWSEQGYTSCSASCLGGVQELIIKCIRNDNDKIVSSFLCPTETKPKPQVRACNDHPCPPRWIYSDFTSCSKSCGIGIKTRDVHCIHEVSRGEENIEVLPNSMCPQPPPADRKYCNVLDCPVRWEVGQWSKCSHTCGDGIKERKVECKQMMAQAHIIERPESMCSSAKPVERKACNVIPCPPEDPNPVISTNNSTHIQRDPKKKKFTVKVGGAAVVFFGTQVKIKCPVKKYDETKIRWTKDHKKLDKSSKFKVSKKGTLRILNVTFLDAGVYLCHAGQSFAEINIEVKAKPGTHSHNYENHELGPPVQEGSGDDSNINMTSDLDQENTHTKQKQQQANVRRRSQKSKSDRQQHRDSSQKIEESTSQQFSR